MNPEQIKCLNLLLEDSLRDLKIGGSAGIYKRMEQFKTGRPKVSFSEYFKSKCGDKKYKKLNTKDRMKQISKEYNKIK